MSKQIHEILGFTTRTSLNEVLKKVWKIQAKFEVGKAPDRYERKFYDDNLSLIKRYYELANDYWKKQLPYDK